MALELPCTSIALTRLIANGKTIEPPVTSMFAPETEIVAESPAALRPTSSVDPFSTAVTARRVLSSRTSKYERNPRCGLLPWLRIESLDLRCGFDTDRLRRLRDMMWALIKVIRRIGKSRDTSRGTGTTQPLSALHVVRVARSLAVRHKPAAVRVSSLRFDAIDHVCRVSYTLQSTLLRQTTPLIISEVRVESKEILRKTRSLHCNMNTTSTDLADALDARVGAESNVLALPSKWLTTRNRWLSGVNYGTSHSRSQPF